MMDRGILLWCGKALAGVIVWMFAGQPISSALGIDGGLFLPLIVVAAVVFVLRDFGA